MLKKSISLMLLFFLVICLNFPSASAQETVASLKSELKSIRQQIKQVTNSYKTELAKINQVSAKKIDVLKKEFHKTRGEYLEEKKNKADKLLEGYKENMKPLKKREKQLRNKIEPLEPNNFARHK